ncbi:hypothetical protein K490DRAFT_66444 [Saccharata proteae CBS 121410]|uniref:Uncharacterized protein n=1 Tax=Saccharata proteae CBS 121410 TaxID=1314787 RepID=A0A9P4HTN0_9PEZI|nr:hypothetical protein K490DRAFT_66444 [Saccharata proteae CBS 121410]
MNLLTGLLALLSLLALALAAPDTQTITIHQWPASAPASAREPLARVTYNPLNSTASLLFYYSPSRPGPASSLVRIGLKNPTPNTDWAGIATSAATLSSQYKKTLVLHADRAGNVFNVGLGATVRREGENEVEVVVEKVKAGPKPVLNRPVVLDENGKLADAKEPEKTFLQKYWWAIGLFLLLQVLVGGGGKE